MLETILYITGPSIEGLMKGDVLWSQINLFDNNKLRSKFLLSDSVGSADSELTSCKI